MTTPPLILWFRRDLRLDDLPMLSAALATGRPLIPVFVLDPETEALGAAAKWRLGLGVAEFARRLEAAGSRLVLRRGAAAAVLLALVEETGAAGVMWSRLYDPAAKARDTGVKSALRARGLLGESHAGHLLHEPWTVATGQGGFYRVYTPYWRTVRGMDVPAPVPAPERLPAPARWPVSERLEDWRMGAAMRRGAAVVAAHVRVGEAAARVRLAEFLSGPVEGYDSARDLPAVAGTSRLSENLTYGEIGIRRVWHAAMAAFHRGAAGAETFLKELVWREFAYHLLHHSPHIAERNWKPEWDAFPWQGDGPQAEAWRRGMTGEPFVDAAMREMYVTGTMHNRGRMIVASYLTKHLMTHWKIGLDWFADCLVDWDPAANAMGWQWAAGSGPDAAPYFRIFNPATQVEKFDPKGAYRRRFIAEGQRAAGAEARAFFEAVPLSWRLDPARPYPARIVDLAEGRARALAAYAGRGGVAG
ncbi:DNA photolyase family protein [Rhodobacteraceae bacterium HSP-20]|uniref:DNA photolyase family protein n=1 Tax=Paragemmobacter amnigenus TaxID=2852097 RepID=A0ABS6J4L1_9RHOB|nr:deoxyribodipyrimidine photo-lyase [Rhodobacter amnigenus]MBU9698696.1 DNA photolyase family protein [Rhodobacter amnigenus]MBV4389923.1 DNA photolyase family protein [Rhodobacter amnigenus]